MKNASLIILICLWAYDSFGINGCGTTEVPGPADCFQAFYDISDNYQINAKSIKVYFHILRDSEGNGGVDESIIEDALYVLDRDFNIDEIEITFNWDGCINYIDNDTYYNTSTSNTFDPMFEEIENIDGIDIVIGHDDHAFNGGKASGLGAEPGGVNRSGLFVGGLWDGCTYPSRDKTDHSATISVLSMKLDICLACTTLFMDVF